MRKSYYGQQSKCNKGYQTIGIIQDNKSRHDEDYRPEMAVRNKLSRLPTRMLCNLFH